MSDTAVCTLFEREYHFGVGALANSLYRSGYRGAIWAGYRGNLPPWATDLRKAPGYEEYAAAPDLVIRFVPLDFDGHLTNCKPDFMLLLLDKYCPEAKSLFFFDADIVVKCNWQYFEEWITHGIAVCSDYVPFSRYSPLIARWREFYEPHGFKFERQLDVMVSGGFLALQAKFASFLRDWKRIQELMFPVIGGPDKTFVKDRNFLFHLTDQDALNVVLHCTDLPLTIATKEAMDFGPDGSVMSHAVGRPKPWRKNPIAEGFRGHSPATADKQYWLYTQTPIKLHPKWRVKLQQLSMRLGSQISRWVRLIIYMTLD